MSDSYFGYQAYVLATHATQMATRLLEALASIGFSCEPITTSAGLRWGCRAPSGWSLNCIAEPDPSKLQAAFQRTWVSWAFFPIEYSQVDELPGAPLLEAIRLASTATDVVLGRSFHPTGLDMISADELSGRPDLLDWVQYFGPTMATAIGTDKIAQAGFHSVEALSNGAYLAITRARYTAPMPSGSLRTLMARLDLQPRTITTRAGEAIRWC